MVDFVQYWLGAFLGLVAEFMAAIRGLFGGLFALVVLAVPLAMTGGCVLENLPGQITGLVCPDCPEPEDACLDWLEDEVDAIME
jgi:hypothetical protein